MQESMEQNKKYQNINNKINGIHEELNYLNNTVNEYLNKEMNFKLNEIMNDSKILNTILNDEYSDENINSSNEIFIKIIGNINELKNILEKYNIENDNIIQNNIFDFNKFYQFLDSLTLLEESAFLHIMIFITLMCIFINILGTFFANEIINYLNIEKKYPSLINFFKVRSKLQKYYLMWNIGLLFLICIGAIYINLLIFYRFNKILINL
jgi:hypothetical protein